MADTPLFVPDLVARKKWIDRRPDIWGNSYTWSWERPWSQLKYVVIHHSVTSHDATPDDVALLHKARGWAGIGYHFVITKDGVVHYVGDISTARANVADMNEQVIGICLIGDFTKHLPSDEQIKSAHDLSKFFFFGTPSLPTLNTWDQLKGHKDLNPTACPGSSWPNDMRDRIIKRLVYSPQPMPEPTPQPTPNPTPQPAPDEYYRVIYKGQQLAALKQNPIAKIENLEKQVSTLEEQAVKLQDKIDTAKVNVQKLVTDLA